MNVRLVAYRRAVDTLAVNIETAYQLDLQKQPNISVNYQFADIKEPEKKKGSFSQTFKLPFTKNNNDFFQNWYNVNTTSTGGIVFDSRKRFAATLYAGSTSQFEGMLQLKSVYQKAKLYEVVLMSTTADLFTRLGNQKLRDIYKLDDGTYSDELDHNYTYENLGYSWDGTTALFTNTDGVSLQDATGGVQKVMYPLSINVPKFWHEPVTSVLAEKRYLAMSGGAKDAMIAAGIDPVQYMVPITQFKPAIQLRTLVKKIFAQAGFGLKSNFMDSTYFRKLFMTTDNHTGMPFPSVNFTPGQVSSMMSVGTTSAIREYVFIAGSSINATTMNLSSGGVGYPSYLLFQDSTSWNTLSLEQTTPITNYNIPSDNYGMWDTSDNTFRKTDVNQNVLNLKFDIYRQNIIGHEDYDYKIKIQIRIRAVGFAPGEGYSIEQVIEHEAPTNSWAGTIPIDTNIDIGILNLNAKYHIDVRPYNFKKSDDSIQALLNIGNANISDVPVRALATITWGGSGEDVYNKVVNVPNCIDPSITQKAFLKDIIERFNLVIVPDIDRPTDLKVETYDDFIASGGIKHWTDKVDTSKEIIIKDTTSLQKKVVHLTDQEDVDLWNKSIKDEAPEFNVYGNINSINTENDFATGEMKNASIFSPYINGKVFAGNDENETTQIPNMAVQYNYTYKRVGTVGYEDDFQPTKPKLFYYSGTKTPLLGAAGISEYYLHGFSQDGNNNVVAYTFNDYPLCTPFELTNSTGVSVIQTTTKSLYWSKQPPVEPNLACFTIAVGNMNLPSGLYSEYWEKYFNIIYHADGRIMECHINLNEADINRLNFGDEIFIKDAYWRVLKIQNYQVGVDASTKVTLLKIPEVFSETCNDCDYVLGSNASGDNMFGDYYMWCPEDNPNCVPNTSFGAASIGLATTAQCCSCNGGEFTPYPSSFGWGSGDLGTCTANTNSPPVQVRDYSSPRALYLAGGLKKLYQGKLNGIDKPLITGTNTTRDTKPLIPYSGDDVVIKYKTTVTGVPPISGESHRFILMGYTSGTTVGYAYLNGDLYAPKITMPSNSIVNLRVKAITTVVGGTSSTYTLGVTEIFTYAAGFRQIDGEDIVRVGSRGGDLEYELAESGKSVTCSLFITSDDAPRIDFGLKDTQADTKRAWQLEVELEINSIANMSIAYDANYALYENGYMIVLQNDDYLLWN